MAPVGLERTWWIGGSPCAGKSTVARGIADRFGLTIYPTDALEARAATSRQPTKAYLQSLTSDELWLRPAEVQVATELDYCREELALAVDEVRRRPGTPRVLVEGTALLPQGVVPLLTRPRQAVWMVPTPEFQRHHYPRRGAWPRQVVTATSDPDRAFALWMERDIRYGRIVAAMARAMDQVVITVDGSQSVAELTDRVCDLLSPPASG